MLSEPLDGVDVIELLGEERSAHLILVTEEVVNRMDGTLSFF